jgi:hypothetical protein
MCRYACKTYKSHYVCFECRKTFKQAHVSDILLRIKKDKVYHGLNGKSIKKVGQVFTKGERKKLEELTAEIRQRRITCPQCAGPMADLGLDFKAPKKTAVKAWKIVEGLVTIGKEFYSCGCDGIGYIPKNPRDYEIYLTKVLKAYDGHLKWNQARTPEDCGNKNAILAYWTGKINTVEAEIARQKLRS